MQSMERMGAPGLGKSVGGAKSQERIGFVMQFHCRRAPVTTVLG
jgi:hypothetical protein